MTIYDEEHEEYFDKTMTIEEMLDTYTNEGYPTMYINPERNNGKWIRVVDKAGHWVWECDASDNRELQLIFARAAMLK